MSKMKSMLLAYGLAAMAMDGNIGGGNRRRTDEMFTDRSKLKGKNKGGEQELIEFTINGEKIKAVNKKMAQKKYNANKNGNMYNF